ncbi:CNH domain-containing protein, partial [Piptocephalis cylindrospora]
LPQGVFTLLADCYSPTCTRHHLCYSIACPRRLEQQARLALAAAASRHSMLYGPSPTQGSPLWSTSVPKHIVEATPNEEKKRQEVLFETIYTEKDFCRDLTILEKLYIAPLRAPGAVKDAFIHEVFGNISEVIRSSSRLSSALQRRQEEASVVRGIGDILLSHAQADFEPFVQYGGRQPYAKHRLDQELARNRPLAKFFESRERLPESRKLPIQSFLGRPTTRLARWPLLVREIVKCTQGNDEDKQDLEEASVTLKALLARMNAATGKAHSRIRLMELSDATGGAGGGESMVRELDLLSSERDLIKEGVLKKRSGTDSVPYIVFLLDHMLLITKKKTVKRKYKIHKRPIPLEMLSLEIPEEGFDAAGIAGAGGIGGVNPLVVGGGGSDKLGYPLVLTHLGRSGTVHILYAPTASDRRQWREALEAQRAKITQARQVFAARSLSLDAFRLGNRVQCSSMIDGGRRMVLGVDDGVYVGEVSEGRLHRIRRVLPVDRVVRVEVLEAYSLLLVHMERHRLLMAYPLEVLESESAVDKGRKVASHVSFFKMGVCLGRTLVCVVKSSGFNSTVIRTLEPVSGSTGGRKKMFGSLLGGSGKSEALVKAFEDFYIPAECNSIHFLSRMLCVGCTKGFEMVELESLNTQGLLDPADESLNFVLKRENVRPVSMYRLMNGDFLLCYDEFAFYVNRLGRRARTHWLVYWEGHPDSFAIRYPYVLAFDPSFIEVRHVETGALEQIIPMGSLRSLSTHTDAIH